MNPLTKKISLPTRERDDQIIEMAREGIPYQKIADHFGLTKGRVSQICVRDGFVRRPFDVNPKNIQNEEMRNVLEELINGEAD